MQGRGDPLQNALVISVTLVLLFMLSCNCDEPNLLTHSDNNVDCYLIFLWYIGADNLHEDLSVSHSAVIESVIT